MEINSHTVVVLDDPFGLLEGQRYEFYLQIEVDKEDELYTENGLLLKVIFAVNHEKAKIMQYYFIEKTSENILDFALEADEEEMVRSYCSENIPAVDTQ